jgi:hypothetical protein
VRISGKSRRAGGNNVGHDGDTWRRRVHDRRFPAKRRAWRETANPWRVQPVSFATARLESSQNYVALNRLAVVDLTPLAGQSAKERRIEHDGCAYPQPVDGIVSGCSLKRNLFPAGRKEVTLTVAETVIILLMLVQIVIDLHLKKAR